MKFDIRTLQTEVVLPVHVLILGVNDGSNHTGQWRFLLEYLCQPSKVRRTPFSAWPPAPHITQRAMNCTGVGGSLCGLMYCPHTCLQRLSKTTKTRNEVSQFSGRDSNMTPFNYNDRQSESNTNCECIILLYVFFWVISRCQTPGNYPEENIQHTEHGESLQSRMYYFIYKV